MPNTKLAIIIFAAVLIAVGIIAWMNLMSEGSEYSAVYLSTGDIYFGKLSWFPSPHLSNVWFVQRSADQAGQQLSVARFTGAFWGPVDKIYFNSKNIIFWSRLRNDSQVVSVLRNPASLQQPPAVQPQTQEIPGSTTMP